MIQMIIKNKQIMNTLNRININLFNARILNFFSYNFSNQQVRVRYAPSPTGFMHLGGLRTALFNYIFAKKNNGQFILRIQDTDQARQVPQSIQNIFQTLEWLSIPPDESIKTQKQPYGPYIQSQRMQKYKNIQKLLLKNNLAYPCFCSYQNKQKNPKIKQNKDKKQGELQDNFYPGTCRNLTFDQMRVKIKNGQKYAVRLKNNLFKHPQFFVDQNYGRIPFTNFDDFVIVKQDGWPTFHFANVIDDWQMKITHVIRGEQWLTNTSKHIYLYKVLNAKIPKFIHLPLIKNQAGKKLAKRDPDSSLLQIKQNYEAIVIKNYLLRLGWTPQNNHSDKQNQKQPKKQKSQKQTKQEGHLDLWSEKEMIQRFDLQHLMKNPAKFDIKVMNYYNKKFLKEEWRKYQRLQKQLNKQAAQQNQSKLQQKTSIFNFFKQKIIKQIPQAKSMNDQIIELVWSIVYERINRNQDLKQFKYYFKDQPIQYGDEKYKKDLKDLFGPQAYIVDNKIRANSEAISKNKKILHNIRLILQHIVEPENYKEEIVSMKFSQFLIQNPQIKNQELFHLLRFAISGHKSGPTASRSIIIFGRQRVLRVLQNFHQMLRP